MQENYKKLWEEYSKDIVKIDLKSLVTKDTLHKSFWDEKRRFLKEIRKQLLTIARDFFDSLGLKGVKIDDITLTGSLASFNWSKYSDIDLHLLVDFAKVNEDEELVREFFNGKAFVWNNKHNILISDHEVEIYVQNTNEPHHSAGVYSLKYDRWLQKPTKDNKNIDFEGVKDKSLHIMDCIERIHELYEDKKYDLAHKCGKKTKEKIKNMRKTGLETSGIGSIENLSFKILRRNGYIGYLNDIIDNSYDKMHSMALKFVKKLKLYVKNDENDEKTGFFALNELEKYQKKLKRRHSRMKKRLIGFGKQRNMPPYSRKPSFKRSKSAPAGAGGS